MKERIHTTLDVFIAEAKTNDKNQLSLNFGQEYIYDIFNKFMSLSPKKTIDGNEIKYKYIHDNGYLSFVTNKSNEILYTYFDEDRKNDFLQHMLKIGFGPNIFATLKRLGKVSMDGYTTIINF